MGIGDSVKGESDEDGEDEPPDDEIEGVVSPLPFARYAAQGGEEIGGDDRADKKCDEGDQLRGAITDQSKKIAAHFNQRISASTIQVLPNTTRAYTRLRLVENLDRGVERKAHRTTRVV